MLSGAIQGLIYGIISSLLGFISFRANLKKCLIINNNLNLKTFDYNGKAYDYVKFLKFEINSCENLSDKQLQKIITKKSKKEDLDVFSEINLLAAKVVLTSRTNKLSINDSILKNEPSITLYESKATLKIGSDIPVGDYYVVPTDDEAYIIIFPSNQQNERDYKHYHIKKSKKFTFNKNEKIKLLRCSLVDISTGEIKDFSTPYVPVSSASSFDGLESSSSPITKKKPRETPTIALIVGKDIPEGVHTFKATHQNGGFVKVEDEKFYVEESKKFKLKDGQTVKLINCEISQRK